MIDITCDEASIERFFKVAERHPAKLRIHEVTLRTPEEARLDVVWAQAELERERLKGKQTNG